MKVSHKKQTEKIKGILYTLKTMNGKPFSFKELKVGSNYENAIKRAGLFQMNKGIVQWTHPNGISDSLVNKIIQEAQDKGREYLRRHNEKVAAIQKPVAPEPQKAFKFETEESDNIRFITDKEQLDRIESKLDQLLNALL